MNTFESRSSNSQEAADKKARGLEKLIRYFELMAKKAGAGEYAIKKTMEEAGLSDEDLRSDPQTRAAALRYVRSHLKDGKFFSAREQLGRLDIKLEDRSSEIRKDLIDNAARWVAQDPYNIDELLSEFEGSFKFSEGEIIEVAKRAVGTSMTDLHPYDLERANKIMEKFRLEKSVLVEAFRKLLLSDLSKRDVVEFGKLDHFLKDPDLREVITSEAVAGLASKVLRKAQAKKDKSAIYESYIKQFKDSFVL